MEPLQTPPETSSFVLLADHQSRTPASFHSGPAVLHHHSKHCKLVILEHELVATPVLNSLRGASTPAPANRTASQSQENAADGEETEGKEIVIDGIDVWVTSDKFLLYNPTLSTGLSIPYPTISLHAVQRLTLPSTPTEVQGLYMQIATPTEQPSEDDFEEHLTLTVVPPPSEAGEGEPESNPDEETPTQALYNAVSACSNLHPDPTSDDEAEGESSLFGAGLVQAGSADGGLPAPVDG
ncbi:hypothetical protein BBP40_000363, partial [Aspergillus hancockii]